MHAKHLAETFLLFALLALSVHASSLQEAKARNLPLCVGHTKVFTCGDTVTESCIMLGNIAAKDSTCFTVSSSRILINCDGHSITGNNHAHAYGIRIEGPGGDTVKNCRIIGFESGIYLDSTSDNRIVNNYASSCARGTMPPTILMGNGFQLYGASNNTFTNNTADSNCRFGFLLSSSPDNTFTDNTVKNVLAFNYICGFAMDSESPNNLFTYNVNEIEYSGTVQKFISGSAQNTLSSRNTGWWPLLKSNGNDSETQEYTAWYNETSGRNADGTFNETLHYWYNNR
ncbi:MAG: right-handed parallel beta-helix repeat-containing protein [Candidatus ainarchaeum sp.]|nr:right-handed parallel beta-helix repeat-containing protein [Candidatus ainarchaeum sp.]